MLMMMRERHAVLRRVRGGAAVVAAVMGLTMMLPSRLDAQRGAPPVAETKPTGIEGLLHVSQLSKDLVRRVQDVVKAGQELPVRVLKVDAKDKRVSLTRFDERGALLGSEEAVEGSVIQDMLDKQQGAKAATNLGSLFKKALDQKHK